MCQLRDQHNITIVTSLRPKQLKVIEQVTQTCLINDLMSIGPQFRIGKAKSFLVIPTGSDNSNGLMILEGIESVGYSSIVLSGPPS